ncbi:O-antigen ligase like membrane protein [Micromonospora siamensis]|uniref:O-antigen ligase like membrane protein n=2 Tax=Micromonospora siamensis TaxID=299152 RepID=A0A1C5I3B7_9ACTN|nr:O-antigen ligase like membrane protein [Micromonospora siamensis]
MGAAPLLPLWPLGAMFGLIPVWWGLGLFYLGWPLLGAVLLALLLVRGRVPLPPGTGVWLFFLAIVLVSATQLAQPSSLVPFGLRLGFYLTALVVGCYVYAAARERGPTAALLVPICAFWFGLVLLGWFGVLAPRFEMTTPVEAALPGGLASNPFVRDMVHLHTSEFSRRSLNPIYRPAAPFSYTNAYGSSYAMTLPCVVAFTMLRRRGLLRWALLASLPFSLVPAFLTLNRAMFLSLGAGLAVLGVRASLRGNIRIAASIVGLVAVAATATLFIPVTDLISNRVDNSDTNTDRFSLYAEVLRRVQESPLLGYGGPVSADTVTAQAPVGTQGQLWMVLFSHGVIALACFLGWFVLAAVRTGRASSPAGQWLAVIPVICLVQIPFYGMANPNLAVAFFMICFALALTERERARPGPGGTTPDGVPRTAVVPA